MREIIAVRSSELYSTAGSKSKHSDWTKVHEWKFPNLRLISYNARNFITPESNTRDYTFLGPSLQTRLKYFWPTLNPSEN